MTDRTKKPLPLHGRYRAARGVFREHAGEKQRQITEPPVYARALGRRYQVERGRHAPGVELAEAVPASDAPFDAALNLWTSLGYYDEETDVRILQEYGKLVRPGGILVIYNARNADRYKMGPGDTPGDPSLAPGIYTVGEALFDTQHPQRLLARADEPVLGPTLAWESNGQYKPGTTFAEGLARTVRWYVERRSAVGAATR